MKKRLTTLFLCLCLVFTMLPATALAGEEQTDGTGAEPGAGCICTGLCGEESVNKECPVCSVEGIDLTVCQGEETQPDAPETLTEAPTDVTESSQEGLGTEDVIITDDSEGVETEGTEGTEETEETETEEPASGCICSELCTGDNINGECPLCGAGGADLTACKGVESQPDTQAKAASAPAVTPRIAYDTLWIGNTRITDSGYWTTDGNGNLTASDAGDYNVAFDADTNTLTLNNANIAGQYDLNYNGSDAGIYAYSSSGAVSLNIQVTGSNVVSGSIGIYALLNGGEVSVRISGGGSLTASGSQTGIWVQSNVSNAALAIEGTAVKASGSYGGVEVQAGESSSGSLSVDGGSLTASGNTGIEFWFSTGMSGSGTPSLIVTGNAVVDAKSGGIAHNSSNNLSIQGNSGIVFNGSTGTVYGNVSLQEDLPIGEGESLTLDHGANLNANGHNVIVDGGILDEGIKNSLGDSVKYTPTITTAGLSNGTAEAAYSTTLLADGTAPITWSVTIGSLPEGLSLDASTGVISGTPTAEGGSTFTVKAANDYGSDSREFTLSIDKPVVIPVTGVKLDKTSLTLQETGSDTLTVTVEPDNATNKGVSWESSDTSIATVDASGKVTAISAGTATITVTTVDNSKTDTCSVTVYTAAAITSQPQSASVREGNGVAFSVTVTGGRMPTYQWQQSTDGGRSWTDISGADADTYTISNTTMAMDGNQYRCVVKDAGGSQVISAAAVLEVYAGSSTIYYALHFETNGGEDMNSVVKESGTVIDLSEYVPVREGYTFIGWYEDEGLTQLVTEVTLDNTKTVYAGWEEIVTDTRLDQVIFMTNPYQKRDLQNGSRNTMSKICTLKLGFAVDDPDLGLSYETSDPSVATVENGKITYRGVGTCVITVTAAETDMCKAASLEIPVTVGSLGIPTFTPTVTARTAPKAFVVTSSTVRGVDGWEVQYSIRDDFWRATTKDFPNTGAKLYRENCTTVHSNMIYYIQVRGYQIIDGEKVYSEWSPVKTIKTK